MEKPQFIQTDAQAILDETVADYEAATGKKLQPGQTERLLINAFAYREYLVRIAANEVGLQSLVAYARAPALDLLGELVGVYRLPPSNAECLIRFYLVAGHGELVIPAGIRIQSIDGQVVFVTTEQKAVAADALTIDIKAQCNTSGSFANGYAIGEIAIILDPQPYLSGAGNLDATNGGGDQENDDELRERIRLAPSSFSNAGSTGAYKYFAKSAHPSIIDVAVNSPTPGEVWIYPLMIDGEAPSEEIKDSVRAKCNDEKVRPLTDTVIVEAPERIEFELTVNLTLLTDAVPSAVEPIVLANLQEYVDKRKTQMGLDVVISQIIAKANIEQVYKVQVVSPSADITIDENQYAVCTALTVNTTGFSDE